MSEEQQQQQQHQQQQQQQKVNKEQLTSSCGSPSSPRSPLKTNIHELRNQDFVSRLLAATPPYLYSAPVGPNNFFFSDMLRSLVQARNNENARSLQLQQQSLLARRPRKRSWAQHRPCYDRKEADEKPLAHPCTTTAAATGAAAASKSAAEKPLELTNKTFFQLPSKFSKAELFKATLAKAPDSEPGKASSSEYEQNSSVDCIAAVGGAAAAVLQHTPPAASLPPQDLVLPPPPPVWYPPLYPPYGIDPLHFFIDLRVSGHIYDRKKENVSPLGSAENNSGSPSKEVSLLGKQRHGSAFTVPVPRSNEAAKAPATGDAINLSANKFENYAKYYDLGESKENRCGSKAATTNYMLQHLPRLYSQFAARDILSAAASSEIDSSFGNDSKSEPDCDAEESADDFDASGANLERDIDVEMIDSIKYRTDESSRCSTPDDVSATQID